MTDRFRKRVAVLISGRGSNLAALIHAAIDPRYPAEIALVVSNREGAAGLEIARDHGIRTRVVPHKAHADRAEHEAAIQEALDSSGTELVCLAGYMRILTPAFVGRWHGRMINIHPSLLPSFKGVDTHARAIQAGCRVHGATVHFVTPEMDEGPIIVQGAVPVLASDTQETLAARVLRIEHRIYPLALRMVAEGSARASGGGVWVADSSADPDQAVISAG